jgi:hypothetical protein
MVHDTTELFISASQIHNDKIIELVIPKKDSSKTKKTIKKGGRKIKSYQHFEEILYEIREEIFEYAHVIITITKKTQYSSSKIIFIDLTAAQSLSTLPIDISLKMELTERRDLEI